MDGYSTACARARGRYVGKVMRMFWHALSNSLAVGPELLQPCASLARLHGALPTKALSGYTLRATSQLCVCANIPGLVGLMSVGNLSGLIWLYARTYVAKTP